MIQNIGRAANFLIPSEKLDMKCGSATLMAEIDRFLYTNFNAYQVVTSEIRGYWRGSFDGIYTQFKVAFLGKERIVILKQFLQAVAFITEQECIYLETGEDVCLVYPEKDKNYRL